MKFPFVRPDIPSPESWIDFLQDSYDRRYFTNFGPVEQRFSSQLERTFGQPDGACCVLTCNATAGLTAALLALTREREGAVAIPAFTFPATLQAVLSARRDVILCDVDPVTWELTPQCIEAAALGRPLCAVIPVRVFGLVRDHQPLLDWATERDLAVIFDSAAALGNGRVTCSDKSPRFVEVFSLHATKSFGIGEGGAIFAPAALRNELRSALNFGIRSDRSFESGINGKMSEFQAAVGLAVADRISDTVSRREEMVSDYRSFFLDYTEITLAKEGRPGPSSNFPILLPEGTPTNDLAQRLEEFGLQARRYYFPSLGGVTLEGVVNPGQGTPVADSLADRMLCLPVYSDCQTHEMREIIMIVKKVLAEFKIC